MTVLNYMQGNVTFINVHHLNKCTRITAEKQS